MYEKEKCGGAVSQNDIYSGNKQTEPSTSFSTPPLSCHLCNQHGTVFHKTNKKTFRTAAVGGLTLLYGFA